MAKKEVRIEDVYNCNACLTFHLREEAPACENRGAGGPCECYGRMCPDCERCDPFGPLCDDPEQIKEAERALNIKVVLR